MIHYKKNSAKSGVYQIRNIKSNKIYIGSAFLLGNRKWKHFKDLILNKHCNQKLQNAYNKYGKENFVFEILELCEKPFLLEKEQFYLNTILHADEDDLYFEQHGYNILRVANNSAGFKHSEETKKKISQIQIGKTVSQEIKDLLYRYSKGRVVSEETREKLRIIGKTKTCSQETREKVSNPVVLYNIISHTQIMYESQKKCAEFLNISESYVSILINTEKIYQKKYQIKNKKDENEKNTSRDIGRN